MRVIGSLVWDEGGEDVWGDGEGELEGRARDRRL